MVSKAIYVPWLHMHQPLVRYRRKIMSNLKMMLLSKNSDVEWNAKLMARAYKNPAKYVKELSKKGLKPKIMLDFSGILLESLEEMTRDFRKLKVDGERIGNIIRLYREALKKYPSSMEFAGTAYSHCYFPVTPVEDWEWQIKEWKNVFSKLFGNKVLERVKGFWLPEMGIPGEEEKLAKLIKILKDNGYEWLILPLEAVEGEKEMSQEERIIMTSQPHILSVKDESITVILKVKYDFLDQQAGCDDDCVYEKSIEAGKTFKVKKKPALVVPASDGENGNVMMNEFFPQTFVPFFKNKIDRNVSSLTVSQFLQEYYDKKKITSKIKIRKIGGSWVGGHERWTEGTRRKEVISKLEEISKKFHEINPKSLKAKDRNIYEKTKRMLLISETSCYTYWNTEFWFSQWKRVMRILDNLLVKLYL